MKYQDVVATFAEKGCHLLTSEDTYTNMNEKIPKYNYIAQCGHEHSVHFNVFKSRGSGIICPKCTSVRNAKKKKKDVCGNKNFQTENTAIQHFVKNIHSFEYRRNFDGCKADLSVKPHPSMDSWLGIQVKSTSLNKNGYSFQLDKKYTDFLLLLVCVVNNKMWLMPYEVVDGNRKISIGATKSKYNIYEVCVDDVDEKLKYYYGILKKFSFETLDTPTCIYQQREKMYRTIREKHVAFLEFESAMEGQVFDFVCNGKKFKRKLEVLVGMAIYSIYTRMMGKKMVKDIWLGTKVETMICIG